MGAQKDYTSQKSVPVIRITASCVAGPILAEFLYVGHLDAATWTDSKRSVVELYCTGQDELQEKIAWINDQRNWWEDALGERIKVETDVIDREDWSETWKRYFHPKMITKRICIKPSWESLSFSAPECVIEIDPGMSFGTGLHGTTAVCLKFIDELCGRNVVMDFLDIGCGSGILSIAAAKLGAASVTAFDFDPLAVERAKENLELNGVNDADVFVGDVSTYVIERRFDVVAANLESRIHLPNLDNIVNSVDEKVGAFLIISGILEVEYGEVSNEFMARGFEEVDAASMDEWRSGLLMRR